MTFSLFDSVLYSLEIIKVQKERTVCVGEGLFLRFSFKLEENFVLHHHWFPPKQHFRCSSSFLLYFFSVGAPRLS